jgi:anthranilate/para-aminobenzoate synthase component II
MKILVIDNQTKHLEHLEAALAGHELVVRDFFRLGPADADGCDAVILSGSAGVPVVYNLSALKSEMALVEGCGLPVLGVCYGFEVIAYMYGSKIKFVDNKIHGYVEINTTKDKGLFAGFDKKAGLLVHEGHRWVVETAGSDLDVLATSENGIEAVKHRHRPIYGVQFHPEASEKAGDGAKIIANFLEIVAAKR